MMHSRTADRPPPSGSSPYGRTRRFPLSACGLTHEPSLLSSPAAHRRLGPSRGRGNPGSLALRKPRMRQQDSVREEAAGPKGDGASVLPVRKQARGHRRGLRPGLVARSQRLAGSPNRRRANAGCSCSGGTRRPWAIRPVLTSRVRTSWIAPRREWTCRARYFRVQARRNHRTWDATPRRQAQFTREEDTRCTPRTRTGGRTS